MKIYRLRSWITSENSRKKIKSTETDVRLDVFYAGKTGLKTAKERFREEVRDFRICHFSYCVSGTRRMGIVEIHEQEINEYGEIRPKYHNMPCFHLREEFTN